MSLPLILSRVLPFGTLNRDLKLIFASNFIGAFGDGLFIYVLPLYIRSLEATSAQVGSLFSILTLSTALTIIPGGFLADHFDRKKIMILGWIIWVPIPLMFSVVTHWTQLFPVMSLYGFFLSGPSTSAYVATSSKRETMTLTYTTLGAGWWLGYIFSPGLGGYLSTLFQMRGVFYLAFVFYATATGVLFFIRSQHAEKNRALTEPNSSNASYAKKIVLLSMFFATVFFFLSLVRPLTVQFFRDVFTLDSFIIGLLGSISFLGSAVFSIFLGRAGDKLGKMIAVSVALIVGGASFGLLICFNNVPSLVTASFLNGTSYTFWPLMGASVGAIAPETSRGRWISVAQMLATISASVAPFVGGVIYEASPYLPFYITIGVCPILSLTALIKPFKEETQLNQNQG